MPVMVGFKKCGISEQSYVIEVSDSENDLQAEVVKMGKEIGIIVVGKMKIWTGKQKFYVKSKTMKKSI